MGRTIIVSNRLPVKIHRKEKEFVCKRSEGGLATGLGSIYKKNHSLWVGWPGLYFENDNEKDQVKKLLSAEQMVPVFLSRQEIKNYYDGFSNETLWPNFHYFPQYAVYEQDYWESYVKVNQKFCEILSRIVKPGDDVWVQDYHLFLLPSMLRSRFPRLTIGFFLHIPFPSYEIFRLLPWEQKLLEGMLGSDLLGFHTIDYARHFLSSLNRSLGINNVGGQILYNGRTIVADAFPMSIDYDLYDTSARSPKVQAIEEKLRRFTGDKKIVLSIDRLDYTKGIPERLAAFEQFLVQHPEYREKVSLIQIIVPSRDKVEMYRQLKEEINRRVGSINSSFGTMTWTPVYYFYRSYPLENLSAFYRLADIALVTPLRDGMNLVCKEYIASRYKKRGVLVLSEFAGASMELSDALMVNPNDVNEVVNMLHAALNMPPDVQEHRMDAMRSIVRKFNIHHWVNLFMDRLTFVKEKQQLLLTRTIDDSVSLTIRDKYLQAKQRLILLDYDGTLVPFKDEPKQAKPDRELVRLIALLAQDPVNRIVIVSGRDRNTLESWFDFARMDMIAEHGVWFKRGDLDWKMAENLDGEWKNQIHPILEQFVNRTPGAFIEEKSFSLAWHYRKVQRGLGEHRSRELVNHLKYITSSMSVNVLEGDMVVEIKNAEVNKGRAIAAWVNKYQDAFILAAGDDFTDEDMFRALPEEAITIKVRNHVSAAKYTLKSSQEMRKLLKKMTRWSAESMSRNQSGTTLSLLKA